LVQVAQKLAPTILAILVTIQFFLRLHHQVVALAVTHQDQLVMAVQVVEPKVTTLQAEHTRLVQELLLKVTMVALQVDQYHLLAAAAAAVQVVLAVTHQAQQQQVAQE
jgi:hypothetical protein